MEVFESPVRAQSEFRRFFGAITHIKCIDVGGGHFEALQGSELLPFLRKVIPNDMLSLS
jgi:hypothetical protein